MFNINNMNAKENSFWAIYLIETFLFLATSLITVASAIKLSTLSSAQKNYYPSPSLSIFDFLFYFLIATVFIVLLVHLKKFDKLKGFIFKGIFIVAVFSGGMVVFNIWLPIGISAVFMAFLIFLWFKKPLVFIHDLVVILGLAGAGSILGISFKPETVIFILLVFSAYDFIAVYKTKHMVKIAREMIETKVILGFIIPKQMSYFKNHIEEVKAGGKFLILGGGDIVFPNLLAVSLIYSGGSSELLRALIVVLFSFFGCLTSSWLFLRQKDKRPVPALPAIALFSIIGYLLGFLV